LNVSQNEYLLKVGWEEGASSSFSPPDTSPNPALQSAVFRQSQRWRSRCPALRSHWFTLPPPC